MLVTLFCHGRSDHRAGQTGHTRFWMIWYMMQGLGNFRNTDHIIFIFDHNVPLVKQFENMGENVCSDIGCHGNGSHHEFQGKVCVQFYSYFL